MRIVLGMTERSGGIFGMLGRPPMGLAGRVT